MPDDPRDPPTIPSIPIKIVGIPGTQTQEALPLPAGTQVEAVTLAAHTPNFTVKVVGPAKAIAVRFTYTFLTSFVGLLAAAITPEGQRHLHTADFLHLLVTCANLSLPIAGLGLAKDLLTIFQKLEGRYTLLDR